MLGVDRVHTREQAQVRQVDACANHAVERRARSFEYCAQIREHLARLEPGVSGRVHTVRIDSVEEYARAVSELAASGVIIQSTESKSRSLEDHFIELVASKERGGHRARAHS